MVSDSLCTASVPRQWKEHSGFGHLVDSDGPQLSTGRDFLLVAAINDWAIANMTFTAMLFPANVGKGFPEQVPSDLVRTAVSEDLPGADFFCFP